MKNNFTTIEFLAALNYDPDIFLDGKVPINILNNDMPVEYESKNFNILFFKLMDKLNNDNIIEILDPHENLDESINLMIYKSYKCKPMEDGRKPAYGLKVSIKKQYRAEFVSRIAKFVWGDENLWEYYRYDYLLNYLNKIDLINLLLDAESKK